MNGGWGPQPTGGVNVAPRNTGGIHWILFAVATALVMPIFSVMGTILAQPRKETCFPGDAYAPTQCLGDGSPGDPTMLRMVYGIIIVTCIIGLILGLIDGRRGAPFASGRYIWAGAVALCGNPAAVAVYALGWFIGGRFKGGGRRSKSKEVDYPTDWRAIGEAETPLFRARAIASFDLQSGGVRQYPGAHLGWTDEGWYVGAKPNSAVLVIGPPRSGKSSAIIIPSILVAEGACVSSSMRDDVMQATWHARATVGQVWHFDPGGDEQPPVGVTPLRWSPLVGIHNWDDARIAANRLAQPLRKSKEGGGDNDHFLDRARDWVEVLLYAAKLEDKDITTVADWSLAADSPEVEDAVNAAFNYAADEWGDGGARIALQQHRGLLDTPDRERGSIKSTMQKLLRIYGSETARRIGANPNFDPEAFVRSSDTVYITASPDRQQEYAPLLAGLLESIRLATYKRHAAEAAGREPKRAPVLFALDEANNTAPIPLPAIISEAGGQSLHVIVGIQDLSRARARWGKEADGFLTLFRIKVIFSGVVEPYTVDALSNAAGEYDRMMVSYSESTQYVGHHAMPVRQQNPTYSTQRQKVLHQGDISNLPPGKALVFEGSEWSLVNYAYHWTPGPWATALNGIEIRNVRARLQREALQTTSNGNTITVQGGGNPHPVIERAEGGDE